MFDNVNGITQQELLALTINELFTQNILKKEDFPPSLIKGLRAEDTTPILSSAQMSVMIEYITQNIDWDLLERSTYGQDVYFNGENGLYTSLKDAIIDYCDTKDYKRINFEHYKSDKPYWNESVERLLQLICQKIDPDFLQKYEKSGKLIVNEDNTIDLEHLRGAIAPKSTTEVAEMRIIDIAHADAGNSFCSEDDLYIYETFYSYLSLVIRTSETSNDKFIVNFRNVLFKPEAEPIFAAIDAGDKISAEDLRKIIGLTDDEKGEYVDTIYSLMNVPTLEDNKTYYVSYGSKTDKEVFKIVKNPWVVPWYNVDGQTYDTVRGADKELSALTNSDKLDFTRKNTDDLLSTSSQAMQDAMEARERVVKYVINRREAEEFSEEWDINYRTNVIYGNINMNDRQILVDSGEVMTVLGGCMSFKLDGILPTAQWTSYKDHYVAICYSPLEQQEGETEPLLWQDSEVEDYLRSIVDSIVDDVNNNVIVDAVTFLREFTRIDGGETGHKLIANIDCVPREEQIENTFSVALAEGLHYIGKFGCVLLEEPYMIEMAENMGITLNELMDLAEFHYNDFYRQYINLTPRWIRLIMPQNKRKVEVEDLNRNFWVIGQTISAISIYLFDEGGPFNDAIKELLKEIGQLWENMLYLWAAITLASQKPFYGETHSEVVVLNSNELYPSLKYDNFDQSAIANSAVISTALNKYINMYPDYNLALVPVIRINNYQHNYYETVQYPGVWVYNRNDDTPAWKIYDITTEQGELGQTISLSEHTDAIIGVRETETTYDICSPLSDAPGLTPDEDQRYYGMIREDIRIDADIQDTIKSMTLTIDLYDIGTYINAVTWEEPDDVMIRIVYSLTADYSVALDRFGVQFTKNFPHLDKHYKHEGRPLNRGYYMGELVSTPLDVARLTYSIKVMNTASLKPTTESSASLIANYTDASHAQMRLEDEAVLTKIINNYIDYNADPTSFWDATRTDAFTIGTNFYGYYNNTDYSDTRNEVDKARYDNTANFYLDEQAWRTSNGNYFRSNEEIKNTTILFVEGEKRCSYESTTNTSVPSYEYFPYSADTDGLLAPVFGTTSTESALTGAVLALPKRDGTRTFGFYDSHTTVGGASTFAIGTNPYVPETDDHTGPYRLIPGQPNQPITWTQSANLLPEEIAIAASTGGAGNTQWLVMLRNDTVEVADDNWRVVKVDSGHLGGITTSREVDGQMVRTYWEKYPMNVANADDNEFFMQIARTKAHLVYQADNSKTVGQIAAEVKSFFQSNNIHKSSYDDTWYYRAAILHGRYADWYIDQCRTNSYFNDWNADLLTILNNNTSGAILRESYGLEDPFGHTFTERPFAAFLTVVSVRIYVFGPSGLYSRRGIYRDADGDFSIIVNELTSNGDVDALRSGYIVISNTSPSRNLEKYKSKFKSLIPDAAIGYTYQDDPNFASYAIQWDPELEQWDTPSNP